MSAVERLTEEVCGERNICCGYPGAEAVAICVDGPACP